MSFSKDFECNTFSHIFHCNFFVERVSELLSVMTILILDWKHHLYIRFNGSVHRIMKRS